MAKGKKVKKSYRVMIPFWLDIMNPDENALRAWIEEMKQKRKFAASVRDGLNLIKSLRDDQSVDKLFNLFPWLKEWFDARIEAAARSQAGGLGIRQELEELKRLLTQQAGLQIIPRLPDSEEIVLEVNQGKADGKTLNRRFLQSLGAISTTAGQPSPANIVVSALEIPSFDELDDISL